MVKQHDQRQKQKKLFHISIPGKMTEPAETGQAYYISKTSERSEQGYVITSKTSERSEQGFICINKTNGRGEQSCICIISRR
jgi:DNA-binding sugar fermentation-stimulating protein